MEGGTIKTRTVDIEAIKAKYLKKKIVVSNECKMVKSVVIYCADLPRKLQRFCKTLWFSCLFVFVLFVFLFVFCLFVFFSYIQMEQ